MKILKISTLVIAIAAILSYSYYVQVNANKMKVDDAITVTK